MSGISDQEAEILLRDDADTADLTEESNESSSGSDTTSSDGSSANASEAPTDPESPKGSPAPTPRDFLRQEEKHEDTRATDAHTKSRSHTPPGILGKKKKKKVRPSPEAPPAENPATAAPPISMEGAPTGTGDIPAPNATSPGSGASSAPKNDPTDPPANVASASTNQLPSATHYLKHGMHMKFFPVDGLPPPPPTESMAHGTSAPPFFVDPASPGDAPGGTWTTNLLKVNGRIGVEVSGQASDNVVRHELAMTEVALNTRRMPCIGLRLSEDFHLVSPTTDSKYKVSVTFATELGPPARPIIAHESYGPFRLAEVKTFLQDRQRLVQSAKSHYLNHITITRHRLALST